MQSVQFLPSSANYPVVAKIDGDLIPFATGRHMNDLGLDGGVKAHAAAKGTAY